MRIAVDAMGGDHAPREIVAGAALAVERLDGEILLVGRQDELEAELKRLQFSHPRLLLHHAPQVVEMDDSPRLALRQKVDSSITVAVDLVRDGQADAAISAGNSGAMMAAATMRLRTLPGIQRPAIAISLPTSSGRTMVLDGGANTECKPEHLAEFGLMGSVYAEHALGIARPRVGLLSIGTERCKGNDLTLATYDLLERLPLNFIGNIEGNQIFQGEVDVAVCDGFVGNVLLKVTEGVGHILMEDFRSVFTSSILGRLAGLLLRPMLRRMKGKYDYAEYGGALLLGVQGLCIVCHGKSSARAMARAIEVGAQDVQSGVQARMVESFSNFDCQSDVAMATEA